MREKKSGNGEKYHPKTHQRLARRLRAAGARAHQGVRDSGELGRWVQRHYRLISWRIAGPSWLGGSSGRCRGEGSSKSGSKTDRLIRGRNHACVVSQATKGRGFFTILSPPLRALLAPATDV